MVFGPHRRLVAGLTLVVACGGDPGPDPMGPSSPAPTPVATTLVMSRSALTFASLGTTRWLSAEVRDQNGAVMTGQTITWTSSDDGVASVSDGNVLSVSNGLATIRASSAGLFAETAVTVEQVVRSVRVTPAAMAFDGPGEGEELTASAFDAGGSIVTSVTAFAWETSDASVATVDADGRVEAVADGSATILATATGHGVAGEAPVNVDSFTLIGNDRFVLAPAGSFVMGDCCANSPEHTVHLTSAFFVMTTEVTVADWRAVMDTIPEHNGACGDDCPVGYVSWDDVQIFVDSLNALDPGRHYRLPTEAEWEYAARAGTTGAYAGTGVLDEMGWHSGNSSLMKHPVAQKAPNGWVLYDTHGNIWEWVHDWHAPYAVGDAWDPSGPATGTYRVLRGGSYRVGAIEARVSWRYGLTPEFRGVDFGFRLARTP